MKPHPFLDRYRFLFSVLVFLLPCAMAHGLGFGINKVRYHTDQHWKILESEHFEIFYYQECETAARKAVDYAENAFVKTSKVFEYVPKNKIPLFIYGTSQEFQETNITPQFLPEGVGGFTEVFKNRIAVPMAGSYHEFESVITHELTHAFQYNLIYGEGWRSVNLFKAVFVPNWMMEGMAEWNAQHWESQGEMVLRDAILNDQVIPLNLLDSFDHFEQVYTAYKESESILEYVSQLYGPEKVGQLMRKMANNQQPDSTVKYVLGISMNELYENWHFYMKSQTWARVNGMPAPEKYGESILPGGVKASVAPDGTRVACLMGGELVIIETGSKKKNTLLKRTFQTQGSGVAWSPDGKLLVFAASRNGEYGLYTADAKDGKTKEYVIPKMPVIYSPQWSPDQKFIVFSGFDYSTVDLYRCEIATGKVERLSNGPESESWATYSLDGRSLYFIREASGETSIQKMELDAQGMPKGPSVSVGTDLGSVASLRVGKDCLYLTSNRDRRIFNLYRTDLDGGRLTRLTNCFADVLSAVPAPDASVFYVGLYQKAQQALYEFPADQFEQTTRPPFDLRYLSNSFGDAGKILAAKKNKKLPTEAEMPEGSEDKEKEENKERKPPVQVPPSVSRLEVTEATNIVQIQWPSITDEEDWVEEYRVYRSASSAATYACLGSVPAAKQEKYVDYTVRTGESYFYYVTAVNKVGEGSPSPIVEAHPFLALKEPKDYQLRISPDILLFLAGYDSSFGFVGGGVFQFSDYLGNHRLGILGDTIPSVRTGVEANYEFSLWRTTVDFNFFYYENFFRIFELQTGSIVNEYRNNENGVDLNFSYPLNTTTRVEYGIGTQRFHGSPLYLRFSEGISNYFQDTSQWNVANYYRISFVKDQRKGTRFWPSSGYGLNFTLLHAPPVFDSNVSFANILFETQVFADLGFMNHLIWANRFIGMTSQGPNPQSFFIGNDAPFQAFFTTIRGYGGQTTFGSNLVLWNTEFRYPIATNMNFIPHPLSFILVKDIELAGFVDTGIVSNHLQDVPTSPVLSSMGTGIRFYNFLYERALIMLRFDVAWRLDQALPPTFHFNLVPMF